MGSPLVHTTVAARYLVETLLGEGGTCAVYRAEDLRANRFVALKVLPAERAAEPEMAARFQREITTGKRLEHPNVVAILDAGSLDDGSKFLVMELCEGRSLDAVMAEGKLAPARAVALARQMLLGLSEAHRLGIAHRDVKPENVILVERDRIETVKLLDFGIASNDRAAMKLTAAGVAFGTPEYISPEMAMGLAADARADLYAVGVVLFQMLTGRLPFTTRDPKALLRAHVQEAAPRLRAIAPELPAALDDAVARALQKLPDDRFQTAAEMIAALDSAPRASSGSRRLAVAVLLAAAVAGLVGAGAWWALHQTESDAPTPPPKSTKKKPPHQVR